MSESNEAAQRRVCDEYRCEFVPAFAKDRAGVALTTVGLLPVNGLRHPTSPGTTGWYIWCGEKMSDAPDYFDPLCISHVVEKLPLVSNFLGLPPGFRFLIANDYLDVWYDDSLLAV